MAFLLLCPRLLSQAWPAPRSLLFLSRQQTPETWPLFSPLELHHCLPLAFSSQSQLHSGLQCIQFPASSLLSKTNTPFVFKGSRCRSQQLCRMAVTEIRALQHLYSPGLGSSVPDSLLRWVRKALVTFKHPFLFQKVELTSAPLFPLSPRLGMNAGVLLSFRKLLPGQKTPARLGISCLTWAVCLSGAFQTGNHSISWLLPFPACPPGDAVSLCLGPNPLRPGGPWLSEWGAASETRTLVSEGITGHRRLKKYDASAWSLTKRPHIFSEFKVFNFLLPKKNLIRESVMNKEGECCKFLFLFFSGENTIRLE